MKHLVRMLVCVFLLCAGTAAAQPIVIDGQFDPAEWSGAVVYTFPVNLPEGGTTAGELRITNDRNNLYVCMRVQENGFHSGESFSIEMDSPSEDGVHGDDDDGVGVSFSSTCEPSSPVGKTFGDFVRYVEPPCPPDTICAASDTAFGGTIDGNGAVGNDGTWTTYELWHPLASADVANDIQLRRREVMGFVAHQRLIDAAMTIADTYYPGPGYTVLATYRVQP